MLNVIHSNKSRCFLSSFWQKKKHKNAQRCNVSFTAKTTCDDDSGSSRNVKSNTTLQSFEVVLCRWIWVSRKLSHGLKRCQQTTNCLRPNSSHRSRPHSSQKTPSSTVLYKKRPRQKHLGRVLVQPQACFACESDKITFQSLSKAMNCAQAGCHQ